MKLDSLTHSSKHVFRAIQTLQSEGIKTTRENVEKRTGYTTRTISRAYRQLENARFIARKDMGQHGNIITILETDA